MSEESRQDWGHKFAISVYVEGEPTEAGMQRLLAGLENLWLPDGTTFVGMAMEVVEEQPNEQVAT